MNINIASLVSEYLEIVLITCAVSYAIFSFCLYMIIRFGSEDGLPTTAFERRVAIKDNPIKKLSSSLDLSSRVIVDLSAVNVKLKDAGYRTLNRWYDFIRSMPDDDQSLDSSLGSEDWRPRTPQ